MARVERPVNRQKHQVKRLWSRASGGGGRYLSAPHPGDGQYSGLRRDLIPLILVGLSRILFSKKSLRAETSHTNSIIGWQNPTDRGPGGAVAVNSGRVMSARKYWSSLGGAFWWGSTVWPIFPL
ncbi:hypothetical protein E2C01_060729 [Portunus trituberculatus]|uniref:Uncharacterized protein n=1 Tax=Portunus trituberculatus TaxID=210409 RepID=A0A5B7H3D3_PORTR|nr:hypothetical protein [Portunus trituberculatus]